MVYKDKFFRILECFDYLVFSEKKEEPQVKVLAREKTRYNDIYVIRNGEHRELWFKGEGEYFLQSRVDTQGQNPLALVYSRMMMVSLLFSQEPERMLDLPRSVVPFFKLEFPLFDPPPLKKPILTDF